MASANVELVHECFPKLTLMKIAIIEYAQETEEEDKQARVNMERSKVVTEAKWSRKKSGHVPWRTRHVIIVINGEAIMQVMLIMPKAIMQVMLIMHKSPSYVLTHNLFSS